ncbi:uncharacterized protein LOC142320622 [Lycorma delicatula]|uniref:uncharacterized protein LOC142320622 n=1 Tax=Lycorma delicatula TaxID=130591 RepID=UPI003F51946A
MANLPVISLKEVALHDSMSDCWIVICNYIYDVTNFMLQHPGGEFVLLDQAGRDATFAFFDAGHTLSSTTSLQKYKIGILPPSECLFNNPSTLLCT